MANGMLKPDEEMAAMMDFEDGIASGASVSDALAGAVSRQPAGAAILADLAVTRRTESVVEGGDALAARVGERADRLMRSRAFPGVMEAAKSAGIKPRDFAAMLGLGKTVLSKLDQRMIELSTIPRALVDEIAQRLDVASSAVWRHLAGRSTLAAANDFRAPQPPQITAAPEPFSMAISTSVSMQEVTAADAARWSSEGPVGPPEG